MNCPICSFYGYWRIPWARDRQAEQLQSRSDDDSTYEWHLCRQCGNAYPSKPPELSILQKLWALNRTDSNASESDKATIWAYRRAIAKAGGERSYRLFTPLTGKKTGRFIDIACGLGETVRVFAAYGWDAEGIDADPSTERFHRDLGIRSRIGQLEQVEIRNNCDIIHIAHAIYFITDPMNFLRMVRERLSPGGLFCVVLADFMANVDPALPSYVHTFFPTASSMRCALALAGFETIFSRRLSGSIFIAARASPDVAKPRVWPLGIRILYATKGLRHAVLGLPYVMLARAVKHFIGRSSQR